MRKSLHFAVAATVILASAGAAFAMGGGGGGGSFNMPTATFDDYATAKRLIKHEEYADAIPHLEKALAKRPNSADILNYLGFAHRMVGMKDTDAQRDGEFRTSLAYYQQALAIDPNHKGVHEYLGELYLQLHDLNGAQRQMNILVTLCPEGCEERDTLSKAIEAYMPPMENPAGAMPAAAPAAATAPAAASTPVAPATPSTPSN
jgi:tetratricopeptide (TPR) repeat protein